ncbi:MAG: hypothetical protein WCI73_02575 [Phycisphaerae bacterium]
MMQVTAKRWQVGGIKAACWVIALGILGVVLGRAAETPKAEGVATTAATAPAPVPQTPTPAVLFAYGFEGGCNHILAARLKRDGLAVNAMGHPSLNGEPLTWERLRRYNVLVITGMDNANTDGTLTEKNLNNIGLIERFMAEGGGVLYVPTWVELDVQMPAQVELLKRVGMKALFDEVVYDSENRTVATVWKLPFAWTDNFVPGPITEGIKNLWYPEAHHTGAQNHTTALQGDKHWQTVVRASKTAETRQSRRGDYTADMAKMPVGTYSKEPVLMASRKMGKGRMVCLAISPKYLFDEAALLSLDGVVFDKGLKGRSSQGYELVRNAIRWLAEPSMGEGEGKLGGAKMDDRLLESPFKTKFVGPWDWAKRVEMPADPPQVRGVVGARTAYSSGKGTVAEWVAAAKQEKLGFIVFLEEFAALTPEKLERLKKDCAAASGPDFTAVPGITIDDEIGNHYFWCSRKLAWPRAELLTADGKKFGSADPKVKGNISGLTLGYMHRQSGMALIGGNYLYKQNAAPFVDWFSDWCASAVITCQDGKQVEDITDGYLTLTKSGQAPSPFAINLVGDPAKIGSSTWLTVLTLGDRVSEGKDLGDRIGAYLSSWHGYSDDPASMYITNGPRIDNFSWVGPRDYEGANRGDFVWQNLRWQVYAKVSSEVGHKEVALYDGTEVLRRFLPQGAKEYTFTMDMTHDRQHALVVIATDVNGGRAISTNMIDRNHRMEEFMCSDRHNQLSYGMVTARDGTRIELGGSQPLSTPNKRVDNKCIAPSGTFKNDWLLGARAFDGAAGGEPLFYSPMSLRQAGKPALGSPNATSAYRLLHTGDVNIGEGRWEHYFNDNIPVRNVWGTLWSAHPAEDFVVKARYHFIQVDPDSPLAIFLWQFDVKLLRDVPNDGLDIGFLGTADAPLWSVRSSEGDVYSGRYEDTVASGRRNLDVPLEPGAYMAALDSPLGGAALLPLTSGVRGMMALPGRGRMSLYLPAAQSPQRAGETRHIELLLLGIPRTTPRTAQLPGATNEVVERFRKDFGLVDGRPTYKLDIAAGKVLAQRYFLKIDGQEVNGFSGQISGQLVSALPIVVSGLNNQWSVVLYDRTLKQARPLGVLENAAWASLALNKQADLFIGHPVVAGEAKLTLQVTQTSDKQWTIEVHNPTDAAIHTTVAPNAWFDPLKDHAPVTVDVPAGGSVVLKW